VKQIGIIADDLSDYFLLKNLNLLAQETTYDCCIFTPNMAKPIIPIAFGLFQVNEIYDYSGIVVASDLKSAKKLLCVPGPSRKLFYIKNFEWMKLVQFSYELIRDCYMSLDLIVRSDRHADVITKCFKKPEMIGDNWEFVWNL
jgi:hypothetical protein